MGPSLHRGDQNSKDRAAPPPLVTIGATFKGKGAGYTRTVVAFVSPHFQSWPEYVQPVPRPPKTT